LIQTARQNSDNHKKSDLLSAIAEIDEQLRFGNLSEEQHSEISMLNAEISGYIAQIKTLSEMHSDSQIEKLKKEQKDLNDIIASRKSIILSLAEFIAKRAEIALIPLQMPNVKLKLIDIIRSTGEVKNTFKFTYRDLEYHTLSFSQKILAGIEIAGMMRKSIGIDCPVFIDNSESISSFNAVEMPSQVFLMRVVKDQALNVRNVKNEQQLQKAS